MSFIRRAIHAVIIVCAIFAGARAFAHPWDEVPDPGPMPLAAQSGFVEVAGAKLYYETFGSGSPLLLIHNGLGDADDWARVVPILAHRYRVIIADTRGFGRSTRDDRPYAFDLLSADYVALMDALHVPKVIVIGTSDGGIIGLDLAVHHADRIAGLFAQGANADPQGIQAPASMAAIRSALARSQREYLRLSSTPGDYANFRRALDVMDATMPAFTTDELSGIQAPVVIAVADHEESIKPSHSDYLAKVIPGAHRIVLHDVSHFAPLQDPTQFAAAVLKFLQPLPVW